MGKTIPVNIDGSAVIITNPPGATTTQSETGATEEPLDYTFEVPNNSYDPNIEYDDIDWEEATVIVEEWSPTSKNSSLSGIVYNNYDIQALAAASGLSEDEIVDILINDIASNNGIEDINIIYDGDEIALSNPYEALGIDIDDENNEPDANPKGSLHTPVTPDDETNPSYNPQDTGENNKPDANPKGSLHTPVILDDEVDVSNGNKNQEPENTGENNGPDTNPKGSLHTPVTLDDETAPDYNPQDTGENNGPNGTPKGELHEEIYLTGDTVATGGTTKGALPTHMTLDGEVPATDDIGFVVDITQTGDTVVSTGNGEINVKPLDNISAPTVNTAKQYYGKTESQMHSIMNYSSDWCAKFVNFSITNTENYDIPSWYENVKNPDSCTSILTEAKKYEDVVIPHQDVQPGDIILLNWNYEANTQDPDHAGIVTSKYFDEEGNTVISTVEGNTSGVEGGDKVRYMQYVVDETGKIINRYELDEEGNRICDSNKNPKQAYKNEENYTGHVYCCSMQTDGKEKEESQTV